VLIRSDFSQAAPAVKDFLLFFSPVLRTCNFSQFTGITAVVKNYFQLSFAANGLSVTKNAGQTIS
jgi:hypothetical protein